MILLPDFSVLLALGMLAFRKSMNLINKSNPFQIPACLQRADSEQRRRERFKKGFIAGVAVVVILLVGLLIEGCMSEKATTQRRPQK